MSVTRIVFVRTWTYSIKSRILWHLLKLTIWLLTYVVTMHMSHLRVSHPNLFLFRALTSRLELIWHYNLTIRMDICIPSSMLTWIVVPAGTICHVDVLWAEHLSPLSGLVLRQHIFTMVGVLLKTGGALHGVILLQRGT